MRRKLDKIIFIDLEATCWKDKGEQGNQVSDIIEIGACFLNMSTGEPENKKSYIVLPTRSTISEFCVELTGIDNALIKARGIPFEHAINKLKKDFGPCLRTWASWGAYDRIKLERECRYFCVPYPFGVNHINAKNLYALKHGLTKELGMKRALAHAGIELEGRQHSGADDAWNSAKLLWTVFGDEK